MLLRYVRYLKNYMMTKPKKNVIAIVGTTGVGKSQFSIELAKSLNGEVVNADSMQVYQKVPIITNKHPIEERYGVAHHVMDHIPWSQDYFIHKYTQEAQAAIDDIHSRNKTPIIIGGTHYYLQSLLFHNKTVGEKESDLGVTSLTEDQKQLLDGPVEAIFSKLASVDPVISEKFHPQDKRKLRRCLEIYFTTGQKPSDMYRDQKLDEMEDSSLKYNTLLFWVYCDPQILADRLDKRVDTMMENGALEEIKELNEFYSAHVPALDPTKGLWQVIGFKEFLPWLQNGQSDSRLFEDGVERMKIRTRQYAKYQVKWIKKLLGVELIKEARFNFKYGGKLYILDASDLTQWSSTVNDRGLSIASKFLKDGPSAVTENQAPDYLQSMIPTAEFFDTFKSNKKIESAKSWKHYECPVCKDSKGQPLLAVGEASWKIHESSRRHKRQVSSGERKRKHEELIKKYKAKEEPKDKEEDRM